MKKRIVAIMLVLVVPLLALLGLMWSSFSNESNEMIVRDNLFPVWWEDEYFGEINEERRVMVENNDLLLMTSLSEIDPEFYEDLNYFDIEPGFSLFVRSPDMSLIPGEGWAHFMELETPQDLIYVVVENRSRVTKMNFILKIFYNYEEIAFQVVGSEREVTEFLFSPPAGYESIIPIHLSESLESNEMANRLTVGIFMSPEQFASEDEELVWETPLMLLNFEINFGERGALYLEVEPDFLTTELPNMTHSGIMINNESIPLQDAVRVPPSKWNVSPGEEVEMFFATNPSSIIDEEIEEFLIISLLDWHQIAMNGNPYLLISLNEQNNEYGHHGGFFITAPDEPGLYEFIAFLVPNPRSLNGPTNFYPLEAGLRFTLEVE